MFNVNPCNAFISAIAFIVALYAVSAQASKVDPTGPFGHSSISSQSYADKKLVLESIIHGDGIHTVVINGKVLRPNDTIGEYRLTAVNDQSVILRSETQRLKLYIFKENIVKASVVK